MLVWIVILMVLMIVKMVMLMEVMTVLIEKDTHGYKQITRS